MSLVVYHNGYGMVCPLKVVTQMHTHNLMKWYQRGADGDLVAVVLYWSVAYCYFVCNPGQLAECSAFQSSGAALYCCEGLYLCGLVQYCRLQSVCLFDMSVWSFVLVDCLWHSDTVHS